ncbi:MAG: hypothetical protein ACI8QT_000907 [Halioglobus sp.]|jgi:hypothetical protein
MRNSGSFLDWTSAFAPSIDELAWFVLLFLFELETYVMSDADFTRARTLTLHGTRFICYLFLAHTLYAYAVSINDLRELAPIEDAGQLCQLSGADISFGSNLEYTQLNPTNCSSLSTGDKFYLIEDGAVVTDVPGLAIERQLTWIDLMEATIWLAILFCIELKVRLQDRGIASGRTVVAITVTSLLLYGLLWLAAGYWIYRGHFMYAWDEALWILGFSAIEMNLSEWKKEIIEARG